MDKEWDLLKTDKDGDQHWIQNSKAGQTIWIMIRLEFGSTKLRRKLVKVNPLT